MRRHTLHGAAACSDGWLSLHTNPNGWIEGPGRQEKGAGSRSGYAAGDRRGCNTTQITLSNGRIVVRAQREPCVTQLVVGGSDTC